MIELRGVSKTVPSGTGTLTILHPIDLAIEAGRVVAITGPSVCGNADASVWSRPAFHPNQTAREHRPCNLDRRPAGFGLRAQ